MKNLHILSLSLATFFLLSCSFTIVLSFSPSRTLQSQCLDDQRSALLQLQQGLYYSHNFTFSSKAELWNVNIDCCSWKGVTCDTLGHVIGLDLNYKNLSESCFNGQIPMGISYLTRLVSLDLSYQDSCYRRNDQSVELYGDYFPTLKLEKPNFKTLIKHMKSLTELYLDRVNISTQSTKWCEITSLALPKLRVLSLSSCGLTGPLCSSLSRLHFLSKLNLDYNPISYLPHNFLEISSRLVSLSLVNCSLSGRFPTKVFLLPKMKSIDISRNRNLTGQLPEFPLISILQVLSLYGTNFSGKLPESLDNLKFLTHLGLFRCNFFGQVPSAIANLTNLVYLDLRHNYLRGSIPKSIFKLPRLEKLYIGYNNFDSLKLDMFSQLKNLRGLDLSNMSLSFNAIDFPKKFPRGDANSSIPMLRWLLLQSCNISTFPEILKSQENLEYLDLSNNKISGAVPNWVWKKSLQYLSLSNNHLSSLDQFLSNQSLTSSQGSSPRPICDLSQLWYFNASYNNLSGSIPNCLGNISTLYYLDLQGNNFTGFLPNFVKAANLRILKVNENRLEGKLPRSLAKCTYLEVLDVGNNMMHDTFPFWLEKLPALEVLVLRENKFYGQIKRFKRKLFFPTLDVLDIASNEFSGELSIDSLQATQLRSLQIGGNKLEGKLPRSLANCTKLEVLDLGKNIIHDTFPFWLGKLPFLKVLILRANKFYGTIQVSVAENAFPMLRILDLASNNFSGELSVEFLQSLRAMMVWTDGNKAKLDYIGEDNYQDSVTIVNKGLEMVLEKILTIFTCLDLSNNSFHGRIPKEIQNLGSLIVLNLSHNSFSGQIPLALENLKELESLDLSQNKLSGKIPPQLTSLTFLSALDLSYNNLEGSIPQSNQFNTFSNDSYRGNPRLCGPPLTRKCNEVGVPPSIPGEDVDSLVDGISDWKIVLIGYGCGMVIGLCIGYTVLNEMGNKWRDNCKRNGKRNGRRSR
ncbi:PREDICTED: receptor like protein 30 [Theobroma cacao]|uniref:Receptor like protein 30 n=1 Tax=Theobroma cacao TaxID=3641 RepID=A0AB32W7L9_THECC|nr:PREDICTED: receptor like protein 30 [Theobroma cacao]XP_017975902.1 PREDICTED: receptor like protein 30 [Theobroma cacao]XP_017975903.1 PREDICTED: receptor like protein 30 [Theobroma cacao]XP_017975904.1 PREDICTED: receptor like protein 30 [Theobroma cacao]XP_017975905.1 PREDICTED: receptor like protein 30 [Theobroma cacao]XP_017975906.1 PREDICTED: receptor like protein 30 [Theobroma cacao]